MFIINIIIFFFLLNFIPYSLRVCIHFNNDFKLIDWEITLSLKQGHLKDNIHINVQILSSFLII